MSEKYGQWQTSECGHAAYMVEPDNDDEECNTFTITVRDCERRRWPERESIQTLHCVTCSHRVDAYDPGLCTVLDEEGRLVPLAK